MPPTKVIVIGAGVGGAATAARLAQRNLQVTVVEKNEYVGGRCSSIVNEGYRFDQGPSLLLMPEFFVETFRDLGTMLESEGIDLIKCEPNYRIWFSDNESMDISTDMVAMRKVLERCEGQGGFEAFLKFLRESRQHYDISSAYVLRRNFPTFWSMLYPGLILSLFRLHPFESIYKRVSQRFRSEKLRQAFTFASMYMGMSPFDAPATYSLLQCSELVDGIWYPAGGFQTIPEALVKVGKRFGAQYRLNSPVSSIQLSRDGRTATGVLLESGEILEADLVIVNADLTYAYNNLLPRSKYSEDLKRRNTSCSSISFFWSFDKTIPGLQCHNVFLAKEYRESFDHIFVHKTIPPTPSFYVHVPARLDSTAAPNGKDAIVVLVPAGHLPGPSAQSEMDQEEYSRLIVSKTRDMVIQTIEERTGLSNLRKSLVHEQVETPFTWETKYNLDRGAILGLSHSFFNVLSFRPKTRHSSIDGLFFVGASTHPGTGVPICLAGSKIVSEQVLASLKGKEKAWSTLPSFFLSLCGILSIIAGIFLANNSVFRSSGSK